MLVEIDWSWIDDPDDPRWDDQYSVYAYLHPVQNWLLYIGKADYATVRQRTYGEHKAEIFEGISDAYDVDEIRTLHGELILPDGIRRTSPLLSDIESLLIMRLQPRWNTQSRASRIMRPGLRVRCVGDWPFKRGLFHDV